MSGPRTFFFDATACSGCKACVVACQDRHGLAAGMEWRRVPEVAGGGWERDGAAWRHSVFAYHLSMACNHCARPICLEGCPARAITRRDDGVVLIDPGRCLGCGYCGWVCPYSAPRYDTTAGVMSKCTFCADDVDAGGEPACVGACPVRALDAGERDELAERHGAAAVDGPPLPDADLTEPALLLAPHADAGRSGEPGTALTPRPPRGLREWSLVVFTVLSQAAAGTSLGAAVLRGWGRGADAVLMPLAAALMAAALLVSALHLGRPGRAWRSLRHLRSSWLSREILLAGAVLVAAALGARPGAGTWAAWATAPLAAAFLAGMSRVYMQRTVPVWNTRRTPLGFVVTALVLGGLTVNAVVWSRTAAPAPLPAILSWAALALAVADQLRRRRIFYARYERTGV